MKKNIKEYVLIGLIAIVLPTLGVLLLSESENKPSTDENVVKNKEEESNGIKIDTKLYGIDINNNGKDDLVDIVEGARNEVTNKVKYISVYHTGGYPPPEEGVCTDVIWRALKNAGINLKEEMDKDIKNNLKDYKVGVVRPDPNIDFRRVKNQKVYFEKYYTNLIKEVNSNDIENLKQWQPGDIVTKIGGDHVAILSDKRNEKGVPYVLHNYYNHAMEEDLLEQWYKDGKITGHFRLNYNKYKK